MQIFILNYIKFERSFITCIWIGIAGGSWEWRWRWIQDVAEPGSSERIDSPAMFYYERHKKGQWWDPEENRQVAPTPLWPSQRAHIFWWGAVDFLIS